MEKTTSFGFKKVLLEEKEHLVKNVFSSVASKYDLMNDLMSLGIHRLWKRSFVQQILDVVPFKGKCLDVGGGTGDITFQLLKESPSLIPVILDVNHEMLVEGKSRALDKGFHNKISWVRANAEQLPFIDNYFDVYVSAFCYRNITNIQRALKEALRVLKPGGSFFCLEFSKVENKVLNHAYKWWSFNVIPKIGEIVGKNQAAYKYLVESIDRFYGPEELRLMIEKAGFKAVKVKILSSGIVAIHSGLKI